MDTSENFFPKLKYPAVTTKFLSAMAADPSSLTDNQQVVVVQCVGVHHINEQPFPILAARELGKLCSIHFRVPNLLFPSLKQRSYPYYGENDLKKGDLKLLHAEPGSNVYKLLYEKYYDNDGTRFSPKYFIGGAINYVTSNAERVGERVVLFENSFQNPHPQVTVRLNHGDVVGSIFGNPKEENPLHVTDFYRDLMRTHLQPKT